MSKTPRDCARALLEVIPPVMHAIRTEMRARRGPDLSVPQFRTLAFIGRCPGASASQVAEHVGLTLASISKRLDGLVARALVVRRESPADRRRVALTLTPAGQAILRCARRAAQARLAERFRGLSAAERASLAAGLDVLRAAFAAAGAGEG